MRALLAVLPWFLIANTFAEDPVSVAKVPPKPEAFLMLPEPRSMRSSISQPIGGAKRTVFTPAKSDDRGKVTTYTAAEFAKIGLSWDSFLERAQKAADIRLAAIQPELKNDASGKAVYAVFRSDEETIASLIIAPGLEQIFKKLFPAGIRLVAPDRHTLFVFPAADGVIEPFAEDLAERFEENTFAASEEIFERKPGAEGIRAIGSIRGK